MRIMIGIILILFSFANASNVTIPNELQSCKQVADCMEVETRCDHCCGVGTVSKESKAKFGELFLKTCKGYHGRVCDCAPARYHLECKDGRCAVVFEK